MSLAMQREMEASEPAIRGEGNHEARDQIDEDPSIIKDQTKKSVEVSNASSPIPSIKESGSERKMGVHELRIE